MKRIVALFIFLCAVVVVGFLVLVSYTESTRYVHIALGALVVVTAASGVATFVIISSKRTKIQRPGRHLHVVEGHAVEYPPTCIIDSGIRSKSVWWVAFNSLTGDYIDHDDNVSALKERTKGREHRIIASRNRADVIAYLQKHPQ